MTKLVAFNLDGILNMTHAYAVATYQEALKELEAGPVAESVICSRFGTPSRDDSLFLLGDGNEEAFRYFYRVVERYWALLIRERVQTYPGTPGMLGELKERGYVLAVCSNAKEERLEDVLDVLPIREYFDYVQGLTSRQDKVDSLDVPTEWANADWCRMVRNHFYDRETVKASETAPIGCGYGHGGVDEFGDGDLLAEDSVEVPGLPEWLIFSTPQLRSWQRPQRDRGAGITGDHGGFRNPISSLKKERTLPMIG